MMRPTPLPSAPLLRAPLLRAPLLRAPLLAIAVLAVLAGCTQPVAIDPGPEATDPLCAEVVVRLPDAIGDAERRETNAQGTGAWGTPAEALLVCGVEVSEVSSLECREFDGVDWLIDTSDEDLVTATTYGREPAVRVIIDRDVLGPGQILADLSSAVSVVPATKACG